MKNQNVTVKRLERTFIRLIIVMALQEFIILLYAFVNDVFGFKAFAISTISLIAIFIGYKFRTFIVYIFITIWIIAYPTYIFSLHVKLGILPLILVISVPAVLISANQVKTAKLKVEGAYNNYLQSTTTVLVDSYTGFANQKVFEKMYNQNLNINSIHDDYDFYIFGIKISFVDSVIENIGHEKYIHYLNQVKVDFISKYPDTSFYCFSENKFTVLNPLITPSQVVEFEKDLKSQFFDTVVEKADKTLYQIYPQVAFYHSSELLDLNSSAVENAEKLLFTRVEADLNAEYF